MFDYAYNNNYTIDEEKKQDTNEKSYCQVIVGSFFHTDLLMLPYPGLLTFCLLKSGHCKQFFSVSAYCSFQSHHMPDYRVFISFPVFLWCFR